jgi:hypothetical protein
VVGVVTVIDIGDAKFDFEHCCRKSHAIVSTLVVFPYQSGRVVPLMLTDIDERASAHAHLLRPRRQHDHSESRPR